MPKQDSRPKKLLLVLPVPMRRTGGRRFVESQAVNGLLRWSDNFDRVTATMVCYPEAIAEGLAGVRWECIDDREDLRQVDVVELPYGYTPRLHLRLAAAVRDRLDRMIDESHYLCFAIGGYFGDWGSVAALLCVRKRRKFSVWTDRVESRVIQSDAMKKRNVLKKAYGLAYARWVKMYEARVIRTSALGLFHGRDTFDAYHGYLAASYQVHNVHLQASDRIPTEQLIQKEQRLFAGGRAHLVHDIHLSEADRLPRRLAMKKSASVGGNSVGFRIGYAGRAAEMKAPLEWLEVIRVLAGNGHAVKATWLGDGPLLPAMKDFVQRHGLGHMVDLPGFVADRDRVVAELRSWDVLLFTHITPESPRILLESMVSATPIVGYDNAYARDLVAGFGEPFLTPVGEPEQLAGAMGKLLATPEILRALMHATWEHSREFNDVAVFRHRSALIKEVLG